MSPPRNAKRQNLARYGTRGASVRVFVEKGGELVRVQWYDGPPKAKRLRTESFPNTPEKRQEARAYGQTIAEGLDQRRGTAAPLSSRALWERYAEAERDHLRPRTWILNADGWRKWELVVGWETIAEDLGPDSLAKLRAELERQGLAVRTIARVIRSVKRVYAWAEEHELLTRNRIHRYRFKVGKDHRPPKVAEFTPADFVKLMAELRIDSSRTWRAGCVMRICGYQGIRQNAVLHLQLDDIDRAGKRIHWRPEWDKLGRDRWQPLRAPTLRVLEVVLEWREKNGYAGPWLFPKPRQGQRPSGPKGEVYTKQALWWSIREAEKRAGIAHLPQRGAHGFRRMLATDVMALTGNLKQAGDAIGDEDLRVLQQSYLSSREEELRAVFDRLDLTAPNPETVMPTVTELGSALVGEENAVGEKDLEDEGGGTRTHDLLIQAPPTNVASQRETPTENVEKSADSDRNAPKDVIQTVTQPQLERGAEPAE